LSGARPVTVRFYSAFSTAVKSAGLGKKHC